MSQALIEFLTLSIGTSLVVINWIIHSRKSKALKESRQLTSLLSEQLLSKSFQVICKEAHIKDLKAYNAHREALIHKARKELAFHADFPLFYVSDDALPEVIKEELEMRHANSINPTDYKLASKCGGKAFRVVDAIKRGKL